MANTSVKFPKTLSIGLTEQMHARLVDVAAMQERTPTSLARIAIRAYLDDLEVGRPIRPKLIHTPERVREEA